MPGQGKAKSKQKQGMASKSAPRSTAKRKAVATNSTQPPKQPKRQSVVEDPNQDANNELDAMNGDIMSERLEKLIESKINDIVKRSLTKLDHETLSDATQQCTKSSKDSVTVPSGSEEKSREDNQPSASTSDSAFQTVSSLLQPGTSNNKPSPSAEDIMQGVESLLSASLAPATLATYRRAWELFSQFSGLFFDGNIKIPISASKMALFVAFLHQKPMTSKSISTYLSGISYIHKLAGMNDPSGHFLVTSLVKGAQRLAPSYDLRLPITVTVLNKLTDALQHTCETYYHQNLFIAMFLFAFNAFARCSEITLSKPGTKSFILKLADVELTYKEKKPTTVTVTFKYFKHNYGKPHVLSFSHGHTNISPPVAMHDYLTLRGRHDGPLFALTSGLPVPRKMFEKKLASTLNFCGLDGKKYKSHSFRIGKATDCAQRGYSDAKIRSLGRWNSNAFQKYIRNSE